MSLKNLGITFEKVKSAFNLIDEATGNGYVQNLGDILDSILDGVSIEDAAKSLKSLGVEADELCFKLVEMGYDSTEVFARFGTSSEKSVGKLSTVFTGLAAKIGISTTALGLLTAGVVALGAAFVGFNLYNQYLDDLVDNAREASSVWSQSNSSIEAQTERFNELRAAIRSGTLSEEEAYNAKAELRDIQKKLTDSYGEWADGIDLVNGSLYEQNKILTMMGARNANEFLNENKKAVDIATEAMEKIHSFEIGEMSIADNAKAKQEIEEIVTKYSEYIDIVEDATGNGAQYIRFHGDASDAEKVLNDFMSDVRSSAQSFDDASLFDSILDSASNGLSRMTEILDEYQDIYKQSQIALITRDQTKYEDSFGRTQTASKWLSEYAAAVQEYNDALASGDTSAIDASAVKFSELDSEIKAMTGENGEMHRYIELFEEIIAQLNKAAIAQNTFTNALKNGTNIGGIPIQGLANELKNLDLDDIDIKYALGTEGIQEGENEIRGLIQVAQELGLITGDSAEDVQGLIDILIELGYISGGTSDSISELASDTDDSFSKVKSDAEEFISEMNSVRDILSQQATGTSLSADAYGSEELKGYTSALEYNNGALQLNREKVNELIEAKAEEQIANIESEKALAQTTYLEKAKEIEKLRKKLKDKNFVEDETAESIQSTIDSLLDENKTLKSQCTQYDLMSASLREATSAYHNWINAQNATESGDMFDDALSAIQEINDTLNNSESDLYQRVNREGYKAAVDFIIPETIDHTDQAAINAYLGTVKSIFETNTDGDFIGLDIAGFCEQAVKQGLMVIDESTGDYRIAAGKTMENFAQGLIDGYDLPMALMQAFFGELGEFVQFDWSDEAQKTLGDLAVEANEAAESLRGLDSSIEINLDVSDLEDNEEKAKALESTIKQMQDLKAKPKVDPSSVEHADTIIRYCVAALHELEPPVTLSLDLTKLNADQATAAQMINDFELAYRNLDLQLRLNNTDGIADAKLEVERLRGELQLSQNTCLVGLKLDYSSAETLRSDIKSLTKTDITTKWNIDDEAFITLQEESSETLKQEVKVEVDDREFNKFIKRLGSKDFVIRVVMDDSGSSSTKPSAKPSGGGNKPHTEISFGDAMAGGNYKSVAGKTLLGELGEELVVDRRTGKWYTVGSNGAEFVYLPKDAIVFDHLQTKDLLEHHFVSSRAHQLAGSAMVSGNAMVSGSIPKDLVNKLSSGGSSVSSNAHDVADDFEVFDWIEVAIEKISKAVEKLTDAASSAYKSLKTKLTASADAITLVNEQIAVQQAAYRRYMEEADAVGLSDELKQRVQSGALDLSEYDEDTQKLIEDYQEWYDKAQECSAGIDELRNSLAELHEEQFGSVLDDYENQLNLLDHMTDSFDAAIEEQEAKGYLVSSKLYTELQKVEQKRISLLKKELADLENLLSDAMNSGEIEEGSDAWYDMQSSINDVKSEIQDATIALQEYNNELRNLEWERFDYQQERISALTDEANFLIDLLSSEKMYDENGKLTDAGHATIGLHGQNYNVYMAQADDYAKEIEDINRDLATDPNNTLLLERKEELLELQRESILAAEDEKQAMIALAEEGIQAEIDAMQKLIDARKDALDSARDLHDYQNKIDDHNEEIGNIRKQIAAYSGEGSEESKAKLQKLSKQLKEAEENLEETEYERYIEDQEKLLDELYLEYESLLNQKLDNTDALIEEMVGSVNANSASISETITAAGDDVGYDISTEMKAIWGSEGLGGVISVYGDEFNKELTAVNEALDDIKDYVESMVEDSDEDADEVIPDVNTVTTPTTEPDKPNTDSEDDDDPIFQKKEPSKINPPGKPIENEITVGGRINAGNAKIYDYAGDTTGNNQYFRDDPIYTVLSEDGDYIEVRHHSLTNGTSGWFRKSDVKAYKTGGLVDYTGLAWVDGQKGKPEAFLNAEDTENIKILAEALKEKFNEPLTILNSSRYNIEHITPNIRGLDDISAMVSSLREQPYTNITSSAGDVNFNISIDHVQDYDDFVRQLQHDRKFEDMIGRMTADRMMGKGSLRKYQVNW